jgi:hypothetical protein
VAWPIDLAVGSWDTGEVTRSDMRPGRQARGWRVLFALVILSPVALASILVAGEAGAGDLAAQNPNVAPPAPRPRAVILRAFAPPPTAALGRALPDPTPLVEKNQWVYDLRYSGGELYLLGIHHLELAAPQATPRAMGRFCLELYEGNTLLERARFDFPLLGDGTDLPPGASGSLPEAGAKLPLGGGRPVSLGRITSRIGVMFPASPRGTRVDIVDRALDRRWPLPWPPTELTAPAVDPSPDAGEVD